MKNSSKLLHSSTIGLLLAGVAVCPLAWSAQTVQIGVTGPFSGPAAQSGLALRQGMETAATEANEQGGLTVNGKKEKIKLLFEDTQDNPAQGVSAAQKLITDNKVDFLIGDAFSTSVTVAEMDLSGQYKMPMMSCEPVGSILSNKVEQHPDKYKYYWKADFGSEAYAATIFDTYKSLIKSGKFKPKSKTIAFIDEDTDYGRSISAKAAKLFQQAGWKVISNNTVALGDTNFNTVLTKLSYRHPGVLVSIFTSADSGIALSHQFNEQGMQASQFAIFYPSRPNFMNGAGSNANGLLWAPLLFDPSQRQADKVLNHKISKRFNTSATTDHAYGYDCMSIVLNAFKKAHSAQPEALTKAMAGTDYKGVLGRYVFDMKNHTVKYGSDYIPVPTAQIRKDGKNVVVWPKKFATGPYQPPAAQ